MFGGAGVVDCLEVAMLMGGRTGPPDPPQQKINLGEKLEFFST